MELSYLVFHIILGALGIAGYIALQFYIIPHFIEDDKKVMVSKYTDYSLTAYLSILYLGSVVSEWNKQRKKSKS